MRKGSAGRPKTLLDFGLPSALARDRRTALSLQPSAGLQGPSRAAQRSASAVQGPSRAPQSTATVIQKPLIAG